jgi:hypothetical protein
MLKNKAATVEEMLSTDHGLTSPGNGFTAPENGAIPDLRRVSKVSGALAPVNLVSTVGWI